MSVHHFRTKLFIDETNNDIDFIVFDFIFDLSPLSLPFFRMHDTHHKLAKRA